MALEAQVLGTGDAFAELSACGMPVERQAELLEAALRERGIAGIAVDAPDLYDLEGDERDAALDAIVEGRPSPYVLVGGRLVSSGAIEMDSVFDAVSACAGHHCGGHGE